MKDEWSFATMQSGVQYVTTFGVLLMPMWSAGSWDFVILVNVFTGKVS